VKDDGDLQMQIDTPYPTEHDDVNHPSHYTMGDEVTDFISSWEMDFHRGNIIKYIVRCPFKKNMVKDLKKAQWYLDDLIKRLEDGKLVI
jgi:hypothetical protein